MKIAILTSAVGGGAGIAALRLYRALLDRSDCEVSLIDAEAMGGPTPSDTALPTSLSNKRLTNTHFTVEYPGHVRGWVLALLEEFDVVNVHWCAYLLTLSELDALSAGGRPVLFTYHDYYYFTGGCHYPAGCTGFLDQCADCPQVDSSRCDDSVIPLNLRIKRRILGRPNVHACAPSRFLIERLGASISIPDERVHVLRNAYAPLTDIEPPDATAAVPRIVLMADSLAEQRKGMGLALDALQLAGQTLQQNGSHAFAVDLIGTATPEIERRVKDLGADVTVHGKIAEHSRIARILALADFLLTASYEDNWPNILVEAGCYACAPIVGPGHGCEEFVRRFSCGEVATDYRPDSLARAIVRALRTITTANRSRFQADVIRAHRPESIAHRYVETMSAMMASAGSEKEATVSSTLC